MAWLDLSNVDGTHVDGGDQPTTTDTDTGTQQTEAGAATCFANQIKERVHSPRTQNAAFEEARLSCVQRALRTPSSLPAKILREPGAL